MVNWTIKTKQEEWLRGACAYITACTLMLTALTIGLWAETGNDLIPLYSLLGLLISTIVFYFITFKVEIIEEKEPTNKTLPMELK